MNGFTLGHQVAVRLMWTHLAELISVVRENLTGNLLRNFNSNHLMLQTP